jgi:hypothetical protein
VSGLLYKRIGLNGLGLIKPNNLLPFFFSFCVYFVEIQGLKVSPIVGLHDDSD